jgi:hypothetical protein
MLVRLALDELDAVVDQVGVEVFDLLLGELDLVEPGGDLVVVQDSLLEPLLNQLLEFLDLGERDFDGEHRPPRFSCWLDSGTDLRRHVKGPSSLRLPGSLPRGGNVSAEARNLEEIF